MNLNKLNKVVQVKATPDFHIRCTMDDGRRVDFDMSFVRHEKGPMIEPLKKWLFFKKVFLEQGVPMWPNGYDVCPDLISMEGVTINKRRRAS